MAENEFLYRYTSIERLATILESRQIRLNPLDKMDDLQEQKTADVENLGKFVFVSSWTEDATESIPMWRMYTDSKAGVRIKMRKNPFARHGTNGTDVAKALPTTTVDKSSSNEKIDTFLDISQLFAGGFYSQQAWDGNLLEKVTYTDDIELLEPSTVHVSEKAIELSYAKMGRYKNTYWSFQKEWRYIMTFIPFGFQCGVDKMPAEFNLTVNRMIRGVQNPPFRFYNLDIAPDCFAEMEITRSPQMTAGNKIILETLVEKFNPSAKIHESDLLGKI